MKSFRSIFIELFGEVPLYSNTIYIEYRIEKRGT